MVVNVLNDTLSNDIETAKPLLHELQLGEQLNECVHQSRRSDFSLMLAMLCDDVREQSQFILPKSAPIDGTSTEKAQVNDLILRKHFDLPEKAPLALKDVKEINQYNQGQLIVEQKFASLNLADAMTPKPLAFRDDNKYVSSNILGNTSISCQEKYELKQDDDTLNKPLNLHVEGWLKSIQTSLVKSILVDVVAA